MPTDTKLIEIMDGPLTAAQHTEIATALVEANRLGAIKERVATAGVEVVPASTVARMEAPVAHTHNGLSLAGLASDHLDAVNQKIRRHVDLQAVIDAAAREEEARRQAAAAEAERQRREAEAAREAWLNTPLEMPWSPITFSNAPVGGHAFLKLSRDGTVEFSGHFHVSGAPSYNVGIAYVVFGGDKAFSFAQGGHLAGTFESGSRDYDWNMHFVNGDIAANWAAIRDSGAWRASATVNWDIGALIQEIATVAGYVGQVIAIVG